jgi:CDP-glucose 4,6-dehydratase
MRTTDSVQVCIIATSDKCYHNDGNTYKPFGESDVLGGVDPYSASKACMELIVDSYRKSFYKENISVSTVRSGNVFGGGDWGNSRLFPDCIKAIERGDMIRIRKPDSVRPWIYMLDSLSGYLHLCSRMMENPRDFNSEWNIGPSEMDENYKTEFIVKRIIELYGKGKYEADGADFFEPAILKINSKKMSEKIGWSPLYDINTGIERTVDWYKMFYDKCDMAAYSMKEIDEYSDNTVMKRKTGSENPI